MIWSMQNGRSDCRSWQESHATYVKKLIDEGKSPSCWFRLSISSASLLRKDIINEETGAIYVEAGDELTLSMDKDGEMIGGTIERADGCGHQ